MTRWLAMMTAMWISSAAAQFGGVFKDLAGAVTKEVGAIKDPIDKTVVYIGFSQLIVAAWFAPLVASYDTLGTERGDGLYSKAATTRHFYFIISDFKGKHVKRIVGVDYEQYRDEPDMSKLSLDFITKEVSAQFNLNALTSVSSSKYFKPEGSLIIYLHGFTDDPTKDSYKNISNAFLFQGVGNVLALDASSLIHWLYLRSSTMVRFIGERLGEAIVSMMKVGLDPKSVHLIGHSLGSHIAGFAGKTVLELAGKRVGRITGLDPAGPCFADVNETLRLNSNDADYVDVIHSDAGVYGLSGNIGHTDYYPNRGSEQPNCLFQTCSHSRAWVLYSESVMDPEGFPAVRCANWKAFQTGKCDFNDISYMGYASKPGTTGQYYLQTAGTSPFALGVRGINHTDNDGIVREIRDHIGLWKR